MSFVDKYLILLFLFVLVQKIAGQDYLEKQYTEALRLYNNKEYFDSITEFKRLLFFDKNGEYSFNANYYIAKCYKSGAKLDDAIKYFSLASITPQDDSTYFVAKLEIIKCNILRRTTNQAFVILDGLEKDVRFSNKLKEIIYWRGWAYIFNDEWGKAAEEFNKIDPEHPLKSMCNQVEDEKYSIIFAKIISAIVPGAGQFYTGEYLSGLMSLGWSGLFAYLSVNSFLADRAFDGLITTGLFFRFHRGNIQNAENFSKAKNVEISNKMLIFLQNSYSGEKP